MHPAVLIRLGVCFVLCGNFICGLSGSEYKIVFLLEGTYLPPEVVIVHRLFCNPQKINCPESLECCRDTNNSLNLAQPEWKCNLTGITSISENQSVRASVVCPNTTEYQTVGCNATLTVLSGSRPDNRTLSPNAIIGLTVGLVAVMFLIIFGFVQLSRRTRQTRSQSDRIVRTPVERQQQVFSASDSHDTAANGLQPLVEIYRAPEPDQNDESRTPTSSRQEPNEDSDADVKTLLEPEAASNAPEVSRPSSTEPQPSVTTPRISSSESLADEEEKKSELAVDLSSSVETIVEKPTDVNPVYQTPPSVASSLASFYTAIGSSSNSDLS